MRLHLPKFSPGKTSVESWIQDTIRELEKWDEAVLKREANMRRGLVFKDGLATSLSFQQIKKDVREVVCNGASETISGLIRAGVVNFGCFTEVTTSITGATGFDVGTPLDLDAYGNNLSVSPAGAKSDFEDYTDRTVAIVTIPTNVILTSRGGSFSSGVVVVSHYYSDFKN